MYCLAAKLQSGHCHYGIERNIKTSRLGYIITICLNVNRKMPADWRGYIVVNVKNTVKTGSLQTESCGVCKWHCVTLKLLINIAILTIVSTVGISFESSSIVLYSIATLEVVFLNVLYINMIISVAVVVVLVNVIVVIIVVVITGVVNVIVVHVTVVVIVNDVFIISIVVIINIIIKKTTTSS